jgi:hypothetical protein
LMSWQSHRPGPQRECWADDRTSHACPANQALSMVGWNALFDKSVREPFSGWRGCRQRGLRDRDWPGFSRRSCIETAESRRRDMCTMDAMSSLSIYFSVGNHFGIDEDFCSSGTFFSSSIYTYLCFRTYASAMARMAFGWARGEQLKTSNLQPSERFLDLGNG